MGSRGKHLENRQAKMARDEVDTEAKVMKSITLSTRDGLYSKDNCKLCNMNS